MQVLVEMKEAITILLIAIHCVTTAQTVSSSVTGQIRKNEKYLFYLHGAVVTELGNNAINQSVPEWGPYEYLDILDSIKKRGFNVISEQRRKTVADSFYARHISNQIDSLIKAGVRVKNIVILGASAGWNIALLVSARQQKKRLRFIIMGGCWPDTYKDYTSTKISGKFLSIIEASDPHQTCRKIFEGRKRITSFEEITLHTGLSHGFIYKGYKEWLDPVVEWISEN